jgi:putative Holliday junction resolvase
VGSAKIGVARGSAMARIAQPLKTLSANSAIDELAALASQSGAEGIVVGLPRSLDGNETAQTSYVRNWAKLAHEHIKLPFYWQDEALTSKIAANQHNEHAAAAAIILQDFLDTPKSDRVRF